MKAKQKPEQGFANREFGFRKHLTLRNLYPFYALASPSQESFNTILRGACMKIKFDRWEEKTTKPNQNGKSWPKIWVFGEALDGKNPGKEWSVSFFKSNKDLAKQVYNLNQGDVVSVEMKKNGNFWNPQNFTVEQGNTGNNGQTSQEDTHASPMLLGAGSSNAPLSEKERCLTYAVDVIGQKPAKSDAAGWALDTTTIAECFMDWLNDKGQFAFQGTTDGIPDEDIEEDTTEVS